MIVATAGLLEKIPEPTIAMTGGYPVESKKEMERIE